MDWQAFGVGTAAVLGPTGAIILGIYTGRAKAKVDKDTAQQLRENAEEVASRQRVESLAAENLELRKRVRELDDEYDEKLRAVRRHAQQGWDLAAIHFGEMTALSHFLNNLFSFISLAGEKPVNREGLENSVRNMMDRVREMKLPRTLEEPLISPPVLPALPPPEIHP